MQLRGLDTRAEFAIAKINVLLGLWDQGDLAVATVGAHAQGHYDFHAGIHTMPRLFEDEPDLCREWHAGQEGAAFDSEIADYRGCQSGDPCPSHG